MSVITNIETSVHRLPLDPPFHAAWDPTPRLAFPVTVYRVYDDEGRMGVGAGDAMRGLVDYVDLFLGRDPLDLGRHGAVLENIAFFDGRPWPLDIALWDLAGKIRGEPLWAMVGGRADRVRLYASSGSHWRIDEVESGVEAVLAAGFGAIKLRMGRLPVEADLEIVAAVRNRAGDRLEIMVDCNQGWRMPWDTASPWSVEDAVALAHSLREFDVYWMEEPLHRSDHRGMHRIRQETGMRLAGGEMTREWYEFHAMLERGSLDVFQPDVAVTCGFGRLIELARLVVESGFVFSPHTWGSGVALLANAHLTAGTVGTTYLEYPFDPPTWTPGRRDFMLDTTLEPTDGWLRLPDGPGLGVSLDEDALSDTLTDLATYG